ncbi:MAG: nickel-dependent hydrogenase large subunit [Rubrivivax sp.]|nr:nickel-dependent hydrogenase large subunit [Rubrivivax sp.]
MSLEGELQLRLQVQAGRIAGVHIGTTRPDIAATLLQGRHRDEVQAAVPLLFSVCARSQAAACRLAIAAAAGLPANGDALASARADVAAEMVREGAWQTLLNWPRWRDEQPSAEATAAARAAQGWRGGGRGGQEAAEAIAHAVFGRRAADWLQLSTWPAIAAWAAAGGTAAARYLHSLQPAAPDVPDLAATPLLDPPDTGWLTALAAAAAADPAFSRHPVCHGQPAETGALARLQADPLLGRHAPPPPSRLLARHVARLRELALLLTGAWQPGLGALGAQELGPGSGLAWADNARGLLVHHVQLDGDLVRLYRIVAPTEWNFHPQGALLTALQGLPVSDASAARQRAGQLVNSLDPCVTCQVEVTDA